MVCYLLSALVCPSVLGMPITRANGTAIRIIRERSEMTIADVIASLTAEGMAIHPDYLRNIELTYKQPSERLLGGIARALKVPKQALRADVEPATASR